MIEKSHKYPQNEDTARCILHYMLHLILKSHIDFGYGWTVVILVVGLARQSRIDLRNNAAEDPDTPSSA